MTALALLAFSLAAGATAAAVVSLAVGAALLAAGRLPLRLTASARFRLLFAAAMAPGFAALAMLLGWMVDRHLLGCGDHHCVTHLHAAVVQATMLVVGTMVLAHLGRRLAQIGTRWRAARRLRRALDHGAARRGDLSVLPLEEPQAFVLGFLRPRAYVSRGLLVAADDGCADSVLAHERAHVRRRDPLRRLVALAGLACHLPAVARELDGALARAQEQAADADAAGDTGDPTRVAAALVRLTRLRMRPPAAALGWGGEGDLEARVEALLSPSPGVDLPGWTITGLSAALLATAVLAADPLHRGAEAVLALLSF